MRLPNSGACSAVNANYFEVFDTKAFSLLAAGIFLLWIFCDTAPAQTHRFRPSETALNLGR